MAGKLTPRRLAGAGVGLLLFLLLLLGGLFLRQERTELTAAQKRLFAPAKVTAILADNAQPEPWSEGLRLGAQQLELEILRGPYKGAVLQAVNYLSAYANVDCQVGTRVIVRLDLDDAGNPYVLSIPNYDRGTVLLAMVGVFALILVLIGGKKGVMALLGLLYTLAGVWFLLIPMVLRGAPPIPSAVAVAALTAAASLLLLTGFSRKTLCAGLGCICGVAAAGLFAWIVGKLTPISGFNMGEAEDLVLRAGEQPLEIRGLLISGILIASLGAVMDVAMSISSALSELKTVNPELTTRGLWKSGMNIGRDMVGTMTNTLILAILGSSTVLILYMYSLSLSWHQLMSSSYMGIEVISSVSSAVGVILAVPLTALTCAIIYGRSQTAPIASTASQKQPKKS